MNIHIPQFLTRKGIFSLLVLLCTLCSAKGYSENFTQENVKKANEIITKIVNAYGGQERLSQLDGILLEYDVININAQQSKATVAPWDRSKGKQVNALSFSKKIAYNESLDTSGGHNIHLATMIKNGKTKQVDHRRQTVAVGVSGNFASVAGPVVRIVSTLLAKQLLIHSTSTRYLGKQKIHGQKTDIISFDMDMGPALTLYINREGYILKSERIIGPFLVEYFFADHRQHQGLYYPHKSWSVINEAPSQEFYISSIDFDYDPARRTKTPSHYRIIDPPPPPQRKVTELAKNVYWVTDGGANNLFIKSEQEVIAVGGSLDSDKRFHALQNRIGKLSLRHAIITHHHSDHVSGVAGLVAEGATIYTVKEHAKIIKNASAHKKPTMVFVNKKMRLQNTSTPIDIYDIGPTPHSEHYLLVHLPEHGIIFEADHFLIPGSGPMPPVTDNVRALVRAIKELKINVKTIASAHAAVLASFDDLLISHRTKEKRK